MSDSKQTCESCGTKFPQSNEVSSSRVLCPPCLEKRRAALRAAKQAGGAPAVANPSASTTSAPGKGVVASQPAAAAAPAPAMRVTRPARTAGTAVRREAEEAKPAPRAGRAGRSPEEHLDIKRLKAEQQAKLMKIGWGVTGACALVVGIVLLFVSNKQEQIKDNRAAYEKSLDDFKQYMFSVNLESESALKTAKERFQSERKLWRGTRIEGDINAQMTKINSSLQTLEKTRSLKEQLEAMEKQLAASPTPETLAVLFKNVRDADIAQQANEFQGELKSRHDTLRKTVSDRYIEVLRASASAAATATTGEGLAPYGALEDTLRVVLDESREANDVEAQQKYGPVYLGVVREINEIVGRVFDDAYIAKQKGVDLLADPNGWLVIPNRPSFQHKFGAGLTLTNAAGETAESGGLTYDAGKSWRDYVIDMEVKVDSGELVFYTRIGEKMDSKLVPAFTLGSKNTNVLAEPGKTYKITVRVIGKEFAVLVDGAQQHGEAELSPTKSRKGEPGIVAKAGTNATITKFSAKHLR